MIRSSNPETSKKKKQSQLDSPERHKNINPKKLSGYYYAGPDGTRREIVLTKQVGRPIVRSNPKWYPMEKKVEACTLYAVYGSIEEVNKLTNVPEKVLREWSREPWWEEILKQVYVEQNDKLGAQITNLLENALITLKDRLENGDYYFQEKSGDLKRKPVDARTLTGLFQSLAIQRRLVRGEPTSITTNKQTLDDKLEKLALEFQRFTKARTIDNNAEFPELQARLQTGAEDSNQEGRGQGQGTEEQSEETCKDQIWEPSLKR